MTARRNLNWSAAAIAALGLALLGNGVWIQAKAMLAQVLLERAFAASIASGQPVKAWEWADTWPVARVSVPHLGRSAIVLEGASGEALAFGPGHLPQSAEPGEAGTTVYAAHRDTHFAFLGAVEAGDTVEVTRIDGRRFTYTVTSSEVVAWNQSGISAERDGAQLALVTCWPLDAKTHGPLRYVVHAALVGAVTDKRMPGA
jgi:sortase A